MQQEPAFYAEGETVWKAPVEHKKTDGSITISLGFKLCRMTDAGGGNAPAVAAILSAHEPLVAYVRRCASNCTEANELLKKVEGR
jgi:hypothetical protein